MLLKPFMKGAACTFAAASLLLSAAVPASAAPVPPKNFSPFPGDELEVTCINESEYNTPGDYQDKVIAWAECTGLITHGRRLYLQKNKNAPQPAMTRGQLLEFLYHLKGRPEVKDLPTTSPYSDISVNDPHYPIAVWATREGITAGWGMESSTTTRWLMKRLRFSSSTGCTANLRWTLPPSRRISSVA